MTDQQRFRFTFARTNFPDTKNKREFGVVSFHEETPCDCSLEFVYDLAEARRVANDICADEAQAEIYHFDGTDLWLLVA
jgi:hypothetical protein